MNGASERFNRLDEPDQWRAILYITEFLENHESRRPLAELEEAFACQRMPAHSFLVDIFDGPLFLMDRLGEQPFTILFDRQYLAETAKHLAHDHLQLAAEVGLTVPDQYPEYDDMAEMYVAFLIEWRDRVAGWLSR